jgi:hypothetical protein
MDEDWDIMNEIEEEQNGGAVAGKKGALSKVQVQDSQTGDMPLGPDQAPESSDDEEVLGRGDRPRKPWKKKGLKRQTRRVIMRPVARKAGKEGDLEDVPEEDEEQADQQVENVPETQPVEGEYGSEAYESNEGDDRDGDLKSIKRRVTKPKTLENGKAAESPAKKAKPKRKVNELAHANFCKLKIKNKNSKAGGRGGRKFGGRR